MDINWFPGHMAKTKRLIKERLGQVDMLIETCDARIPESSRNPELFQLAERKIRILILTKADLADPDITGKWLESYAKQGIDAMAIHAGQRTAMSALIQKMRSLCSDTLVRAAEKGRSGRPLRAMVVGIPNTGKSTLINTLVKRKVAKTEDKPGITRAPQWIKGDDGIELMDMPGVLWPKLGTDQTKIHLALTGAIKDTVIDSEELAYKAFYEILALYPEEMKIRFRLPEEKLALLTKCAATGDANLQRDLQIQIFEQAAELRGCVKKGGVPDHARFATLFLSEFRQGQIGLISLESPM